MQLLVFTFSKNDNLFLDRCFAGNEDFLDIPVNCLGMPVLHRWSFGEFSSHAFSLASMDVFGKALGPAAELDT